MAGFNFPNDIIPKNTFAELYRKYTSIDRLSRFKAVRNIGFRERNLDNDFGKSA